jgi:GNAT superfamily N-acetyltransferase
VDTLNVDIRALEPADLHAAFGLSSTASWNQRFDDWRMLLQLAPAGSVGAMVEGRLVGTAIGIDYGAFGWIAMMLVEPGFRGHGVGARLLEAAMGAVPDDLPIRLDATPLGRPLYQRYGFKDETLLTRHTTSGTNLRIAEPWPAGRGPEVRSLAATDVPSVAASDTRVFQAKRAAVVEWTWEQAPQYAVVAGTGDVPEYCLGRPGRLFDQIGPIVARDHETAGAMLDAVVHASAGRPLLVDAFDSRKTFVARLAGHGFQAQRPLYRMCRPGRLRFADHDHRAGGLTGFAILGPEFG